jgi:DNA (cytosine-5)-methyltransferase 1
MIYGSVCSGIEAATVAWHPLGWKAAFYSEIDKFPSAVLAHHYPAVPNFGDFTTIQPDQHDAIDLLVGGTPCQSFSIAGLRGGMADSRGNLALEYLRLADRARPRWLVWENVPGVLSSNGGRDFGAILGGMGELGYGVAYRVLDAQYCRVDGFWRAVPQRRRRVFVVGYLGDWRRAAAVLFERASLCGDSAPGRKTGQGTTYDAAPCLAASVRGFERAGDTRGQDCVIAADVAPTLNASFGDKQGLEDQHINGGGRCSLPLTAMCLNAGAMVRQDAESETLIPISGGGFDVAHALPAKFSAGDDGTGRGTPIIPVAHMDTMPTMRAGASQDGPGHGARSGDSKDEYIVPVAFNITPSNSNKDYNAREASYAQAVTTDGGAPSARGGDVIAFEATHDVAGTMMSYAKSGGDSNRIDNAAAGYMAVSPQTWAVRRLTPTECERLQGFPDGYTDIPWRGKYSAPDGPRYKALGNSMACNVMRWIGRRIEMVEAMNTLQPLT